LQFRIEARIQSDGQPVNDLPNPYQTIRNWGSLPDGRTWGSLSAIDIDPDGKSVCAPPNVAAARHAAVRHVASIERKSPSID